MKINDDAQLRLGRVHKSYRNTAKATGNETKYLTQNDCLLNLEAATSTRRTADRRGDHKTSLSLVHDIVASFKEGDKVKLTTYPIGRKRKIDKIEGSILGYDEDKKYGWKMHVVDSSQKEHIIDM